MKKRPFFSYLNENFFLNLKKPFYDLFKWKKTCFSHLHEEKSFFELFK